MREIGNSSQYGLIIHIEQLGYSPQYDAQYLQQMIHERGNLRFRSPGWPYHVCELTHAHLTWWRTTFVSGRTCSNMGNEHICNSQVDFFILLPLYVLQMKTTHHNLSPTLLVGGFYFMYVYMLFLKRMITCPTSFGFLGSVMSYCLRSPWIQLLKYRNLSSNESRISVISPEINGTDGTMLLGQVTAATKRCLLNDFTSLKERMCSWFESPI